MTFISTYDALVNSLRLLSRHLAMSSPFDIPKSNKFCEAHRCKLLIYCNEAGLQAGRSMTGGAE